MTTSRASRTFLLWHEPSNFLAVANVKKGRLPLLTILDEEYRGINPFYAYPFYFLKSFGWIDLGDL
jgi:hypothetical protein